MRLAAFALAFTLVSNAASAFDCTDATLPRTVVICSDPELTKLADERQQAFNEARGRIGEDRFPELMADQHAWVESYSVRCGIAPDRAPILPVPLVNKECMRLAGEQRIAYLRAYGVTGAAQSAGAAPPPTAMTTPVAAIPHASNCPKPIWVENHVVCQDAEPPTARTPGPIEPAAIGPEPSSNGGAWWGRPLGLVVVVVVVFIIAANRKANRATNQNRAAVAQYAQTKRKVKTGASTFQVLSWICISAGALCLGFFVWFWWTADDRARTTIAKAERYGISESQYDPDRPTAEEVKDARELLKSSGDLSAAWHELWQVIWRSTPASGPLPITTPGPAQNLADVLGPDPSYEACRDFGGPDHSPVMSSGWIECKADRDAMDARAQAAWDSDVFN